MTTYIYIYIYIYIYDGGCKNYKIETNIVYYRGGGGAGDTFPILCCICEEKLFF